MSNQQSAMREWITGNWELCENESLINIIFNNHFSGETYPD